MPQPRPDSIFTEFSFTKEEWANARILTVLQIAYLQTKYAEAFKLKGSTKVPETNELDRSFCLKMAEIEGELNFIQRMFDEHKAAVQELGIISQAQRVAEGTVDTTAARANAHVHNQS